MLLEDFLTLATQFTLILLAIVSLISYLRSHDQVRLDITLLFGTLALSVLVQQIQDSETVSEELGRWLTYYNQAALMAHPYLLLRLVQDFRPVPKGMQYFAILGLLASLLVLALIPPPQPSLVVALLVAYFLIVELYSAFSLIFGARSTAGVTRWRLILIAAGAGFLALLIFNAGLSNLFPDVQPFLSTLSQLFGLLAMLCYYAGFATPHWLRRSWQLAELQRFLRHTAGPWTGEPIVSTLERLCQVTVRSVGGMDAMVVLWNDQEQKLSIRASTNKALLPIGRMVDSKAVLECWETQSPIEGIVPVELTDKETPIAVSLGAKATIIVPITTKDHPWGVLQLFNRRQSLFAADDVLLLSLFAEQTAIALGYATLVTEQRNLIKQLSQRTGQLEAAYKELESFSYSVSHDLRSPLRHISGYIELLQKHMNASLDDKGRRYIHITLEEAGRMSTLIDDLLAFSRFGRTELHHSEVDFDGLVREIIAALHQEEEGRQLHWHLHALPRVRGDHSMFRLTWTNLISNALKFTRGQPNTEIEIGYQPNTDEAIFYIRDNGAGFNMKYAGQLFGVFQRLHHTTEFEGTGIGLATVHRIVQRHGGRTWAEGAEGEGATFYFTLPVERVVREQPATTPAVARRVKNAGGIKLE